jgi:preprotein translocase subunit YajC
MFELDFNVLTLAQEGATGQPGTPSQAPPTGGGGGGGGAGGGAPASPFGGSFLFIMLGLIVVFLIISSMGPRRERKRREAMLSAIAKHDRVQTVGGVIGSIVEVKPDSVVLKVDESSNTRITFAKSAIQQVLESGGRPKTTT